jgi:hypothetical protein
MGSAKTPEEVSRYFGLKNGIKALFLLDTLSTSQEKIENESRCVIAPSPTRLWLFDKTQITVEPVE